MNTYIHITRCVRVSDDDRVEIFKSTEWSPNSVDHIAWNKIKTFGIKGHSINCAATYNVELRQLSLFHGTISHVLPH
jgi:hypothetical protein